MSSSLRRTKSLLVAVATVAVADAAGLCCTFLRPCVVYHAVHQHGTWSQVFKILSYSSLQLILRSRRYNDVLASARLWRLTNLTKSDRQWRSSSFQESKKVRVSRDLWPWPWPWAQPGCTLTWSPSCETLVAIRPFACEKKRFAQKFTDRRTDGRTDDGRRAIAFAHSWNEL